MYHMFLLDFFNFIPSQFFFLSVLAIDSSLHGVLSRKEGTCVIELASWDFAAQSISGDFHPTFVIHSVICITFFNFTHLQFGFRSGLASKGK